MGRQCEDEPVVYSYVVTSSVLPWMFVRVGVFKMGRGRGGGGGEEEEMYVCGTK